MAYVDLATVRAMDNMDDTGAFPDATITEAIEWATLLIDRYTGTSWEHKTTSVVIPVSGRTYHLRDEEGRAVLFPRSVASVTTKESATATPVAVDTTVWTLFPEGTVTSTESLTGELTATVTAGATSTAPADVQWVARTLARQYALDLVSRIPDRALSVQNDFGTVPLAQAGGITRPTSLPEVNAVLNRRRHRVGPAF